MPVEPYAPFKRSQLTQINRALSDLTEAEKIIERATAAGFDMTPQAKDCAECRKCLEGVVQQFYNRRPSE